MASTSEMPAWDSEESRAKVALCLERFDFKRLVAMMAAVGWTWGLPPFRPTEDQLEEEAVRLLRLSHEEVISGRGSRPASCGGLTAEWGRTNLADRTLWWPRLRFVGHESDGEVWDADE